MNLNHLIKENLFGFVERKAEIQHFIAKDKQMKMLLNEEPNREIITNFQTKRNPQFPKPNQKFRNLVSIKTTKFTLNCHIQLKFN